jgi:hypothetical protein
MYQKIVKASPYADSDRNGVAVRVYYGFAVVIKGPKGVPDGPVVP